MGERFQNDHWIYGVVKQVLERLRVSGKRKAVLSGGLSVSGLQHIGRIRGEVLIGEAVRRELERHGFEAEQYIVLYTQDAWKGRKGQLEAFNGERGKEFVGWPLIRVPDPKGCHSNWVEHYWEDFGGFLSEFSDGKIRVVTTTELYRTLLRGIVRESIEKRDTIREILNRYRGRNPYPSDWIPFEPVCEGCGRIDTTKALRTEGELVEYECKKCGHAGVTTIENGKLNWRIEWAGVWKAMGVDFEPYGKDHGAPGGSRESCIVLSRTVFGYEPPEGVAYEWVSYRTQEGVADMSSSNFIGITPREWYEVADPEVLRFLYYSVHPRKKIVIDMQLVPSYYEEFYRAESLYYDRVEGKLEGYDEESLWTIRSYELSVYGTTLDRRPVQVPYTTMALIVQSLPEGVGLDHVISRLRSSGLVPERITEHDRKRIESLVTRSRAWVRRYAPAGIRYSVLESLPDDVRGRLKYRNALVSLGRRLAELSEWRQDRIKEVMIEATKELDSKSRREFYREFYKVIVGAESGPRAAPLVEALGKEFIVKRLVEDLGS
uniref:Lysine--tRNA ligase n=1 Tax=Fervidicoccus fontis TaxID=683846 RepID=A0A7J3ZK47_9CREN